MLLYCVDYWVLVEGPLRLITVRIELGLIQVRIHVKSSVKLVRFLTAFLCLS